VKDQLAHVVDVGGIPIRWDVDGVGDSDLLLLHGNGAHHMWWYKVAPELERRWRVIRLDLSGHGDSGRRERYSPSFWVDEVIAVLHAAGSQRPVVIGHSMGGRLTLALAADHPDRVKAAILLDASVRPPGRYREFSRSSGRRRYYSDLDAGVASFKLLPRQPDPPVAELLPLARHSLRHDPEGWTWKFDAPALRQFQDAWVDGWAARVTRPLGFVYGSASVVVDDDIAEYVRGRVGGPVEVIRIEGAHHHLVLDHAEETTQAVLKLIDWQDSLGL
jgi:pimeloyl-ACP methyl ester carboxylesterase